MQPCYDSGSGQQCPIQLHSGGINSLRALLLQSWLQTPAPGLEAQLKLRLLLFQALPCVNDCLLCVPAEPPHPQSLCLHLSCKFEFNVAGWSPGGLLAKSETVAGSERSLKHEAVQERSGVCVWWGGRRPVGAEKGKGEKKCGDNNGENG